MAEVRVRVKGVVFVVGWSGEVVSLHAYKIVAGEVVDLIGEGEPILQPLMARSASAFSTPPISFGH